MTVLTDAFRGRLDENREISLDRASISCMIPGLLANAF